MLRIDAASDVGHMRCAKRSSAALRTAVALEQMANRVEVEGLALAPNPLLPTDLRPTSIVTAVQTRGRDQRHRPTGSAQRDAASDVAKLRRDIKNCFEQHPRATACGDVPLVKIPILGRCLRLFGDWHALCAFCGCLAKITPNSRFRNQPCCMRCDFAMLHGKELEETLLANFPRPPPPACRFCGKPQPENGNSRWKMVNAPADTGGRNASVPPPLRVCYYCPTHWRSWLANAHRELPTNVIFAHISSRCKPCYGADHQTRAVQQPTRRKKSAKNASNPSDASPASASDDTARTAVAPDEDEDLRKPQARSLKRSGIRKRVMTHKTHSMKF